MVKKRSSIGSKPIRSPVRASLRNTSWCFQENWPRSSTRRTGSRCHTPARARAPDNRRGDDTIHRRRGLHRQRFVRTLLVVLAGGMIEAALLRPRLAAGGAAVSCFKRAMHALVPSVLLRMPGGDPLRHDAQLHPPHRQPRQSGDGPRGKRRAVVAANRLRQPVLAKRRLEDGLHPRRVGLLHRLAAQQIATVRVADGQRIDALAVPRAEPALEVGAPHPVGFRRPRQTVACRAASAPLLARAITSPSRASIVPDRAGRRPRVFRLLALQHPLQLPRLPNSCVPAATPAPLPRSRLRRLVGMPLRRPTAIAQLRQSGLLDTASTTRSRSRVKPRRSHTTRSSCTHRAPTPGQTALAPPSHCSFSKACPQF